MSTKIYPFIFLAFIMIWTFSLKVDAIIGMALGFVECCLCNGLILKFQSDGFLTFMGRFRCWEPSTEASSMGNPFAGLEDQVEAIRSSQVTKDTSGCSDYFKNKKGIAIV
jgi:hypothetical protein